MRHNYITACLHTFLHSNTFVIQIRICKRSSLPSTKQEPRVIGVRSGKSIDYGPIFPSPKATDARS